MSNQQITAAYCTPELLQEIADRQAAKYPGPYYWHGWLSSQCLTLKAPSGGQYVMDFTKWGANDGGQPVFRAAEGDERVMVKARHCAITKHKDSQEIIGIDNPNAIGFQKSWEDIETLLGMTAWQAARIEELEKQVQTEPIRTLIEMYDGNHLFAMGLFHALKTYFGQWEVKDTPQVLWDARQTLIDWEEFSHTGNHEHFINLLRVDIGMEKPELEEVKPR